MNAIDLFALLWILLSVVRGYYIGFLHQFLSLGGFISGLILGSWIAPTLAAQVDSSAGRLMVTLFSTIGLGLMLSLGGEYLAVLIHNKVKLQFARNVNAGLGMVFGAAATVVIMWLLFTGLGRLPLANIGLMIQESRTMQAIEKLMPGAPTVMERFGRLISPHGFPQIFVGNEPIVDPAGPPATPEVEAAAAHAQGSVVKIEGNACGGVSVGSGFVAANSFIITNAHVIAGVQEPIIVHHGTRYRAVTVWFDSRVDFAVLRVQNLDAPVLPLTDVNVVRGKSAAILGFPGGGRLTIDPAVVLGTREAVGRDIYDRSFVTRQIYEVQGDIDQGNSGGPLVMPDGSVAGIMFGKSVTTDNISYALTSLEISDDLRAAIRENSPRSTGPCI